MRRLSFDKILDYKRHDASKDKVKSNFANNEPNNVKIDKLFLFNQNVWSLKG